MAWITVQIAESNFHDETLPGREARLNTDHIRLVVHDRDSSLLFFQNDDCLRVRPRLEWNETLSDPRLSESAPLS